MGAEVGATASAVVVVVVVVVVRVGVVAVGGVAGWMKKEQTASFVGHAPWPYSFPLTVGGSNSSTCLVPLL